MFCHVICVDRKLSFLTVFDFCIAGIFISNLISMMIVKVYIVRKIQIQVRIISKLFLFLWKVRAASVTCFAGITSSVFSSLMKEKQDFILSSLVSFDAMCT